MSDGETTRLTYVRLQQRLREMASANGAELRVREVDDSIWEATFVSSARPQTLGHDGEVHAATDPADTRRTALENLLAGLLGEHATLSSWRHARRA